MNIFITGGTSGLGLDLALEYLSRGNRVGICGRDLSKIPQEILEKYQKNKKLLFCYTIDVVDLISLKKAILEFSQGQLDIMVANAGISIGHKTALPDFEFARKIIDTNVVGVINSFEVATEIMIQQKKGKLVAIASVAGMIGVPKAAAYCASKAAVLKFCESLSIDLDPMGIKVITIAPGFIDTPLTRKNNHPLPFVLSSPVAANKVFMAIEKNISFYVFPISMKIVIYFLYFLPRSLYRRLMRLVNWGG